MLSTLSLFFFDMYACMQPVIPRLDDNHIGDFGASQIADALKTNVVLQKLRLAGPGYFV